MMITPGRLCAQACIRGGSDNPGICGAANFYKMPAGTLVEICVNGLPGDGGIHALHIHEGGACTGQGFADTGGHYNPRGKPHPMHAGDIPPLFSCQGRAYMSVLTGRFCISDVIGRTVVIHSGADDLHTQPSGNAGSRIACGVICPV